VIGPFGIEWIAWIRVVRSRRVHGFLYLTCDRRAAVVFL
jgi:hypothetical protein